MKKIFLPVLIVGLTIGAFYLAFNQKKKNITVAQSGVALTKDISEVNQQEELGQRAHHEFLMTMDPKLGYVPTERLIEGEKRAAEIMSALGPNGTSTISSLTWTERGPVNIGGRTRALLFDKNDATNNTVLAGGVSGGLWRSTNFKTGSPVTWTKIATISQNLAITCIAQDPQTLNTMYAGTGEGYGNYDAIRGLGVYKSTDGGLTWALLASTTTGGVNVNDFSYVQKILVYNNATHDVYAACRSAVFCNAGGLMRSINGGTSWSRVIGTYPGGGCSFATDFTIYDIEQSFSGDLWVASLTDATGVGKIWRSPAGATVGNTGTWVDKTPTGTFQRIELACSPTNNLRTYALCQGSGSAIGAIFRTDDAAATPASSWTNIINAANTWCDQGTLSTDFSRGQAWYDLTLAIKPDDDNTVFAGGVDIMKTVNAGASWAQATRWSSFGCGTLPIVHADIHNIQYLPASTTEFTVGCDGGLYYTADGGTTFATKNNSYNITQYYSCAINPTSGSNNMMGGAQDNGTHRFTTAGINTVTTPTGGDGGFCFIDQKNPLQQITNYTGLNLNISNNTGSSFSGAYTPGAVDRFINPGDFDTASSTTPALSTAALYYSGYTARRFCRATINFSTPGVSFNNFLISASTTNHSVSAIKVDPNTSNRVWVAMSTADGAAALVVPQLFYFDNANAVPSATAITLPAAITSGQYISSIDVEKGNASHILITISNYGVASVYESTDLGANWTSLDNNGVNLSDVPVRWGMFIPAGYGQSPSAVGGILLATELGVWGTNTITGTTTPWAQNATTMGNVRVDMIKYRGSDKTVIAATHGRGMFTSQLISLLPVNYVWFKGTPLDNANRLSWKIANSANNAGFDIERMYNGESQYTKIGYVAAGNNPATSVEYTYDDKNLDLSKQVAIYRLKQIDINGAFKYSDQIPVKRSQLGNFIYFVSVTGKNNLFVRAGNKTGINKVSVLIYDSQGKVMISRTEQYQDMNIDISRLASGNYFIKLKGLNSEEEFTTQFIK